ncbi:MAG TPA: hypothetical protein VK450_01955, partial [Methanomicrobiales archaeon]|nr:hypothetical protein [Methanomicrobiales archaeon]
GLDDTIREFAQAGTGNGFKFEAASAPALLEALRRALAVRARKESWEALVRNAMSADFSWSRSAREYLALYEKVRTAPRT